MKKGTFINFVRPQIFTGKMRLSIYFIFACQLQFLLGFHLFIKPIIESLLKDYGPRLEFRCLPTTNQPIMV